MFLFCPVGCPTVVISLTISELALAHFQRNLVPQCVRTVGWVANAGGLSGHASCCLQLGELFTGVIVKRRWLLRASSPPPHCSEVSDGSAGRWLRRHVRRVLKSLMDLLGEGSVQGSGEPPSCVVFVFPPCHSHCGWMYCVAAARCLEKLP